MCQYLYLIVPLEDIIHYATYNALGNGTDYRFQYSGYCAPFKQQKSNNTKCIFYEEWVNVMVGGVSLLRDWFQC